MNKRTATNRVIIHCSATSPSIDIGVEEIREWHIKKGWSDIGYHFVIRRDGTIEEGRNIDYIGSHTKGENDDSVGICLVGGVNSAGVPDANFALEQYVSLKELVNSLRLRYGLFLGIYGHRNFSKKACPSFNAWELLKYV